LPLAPKRAFATVGPPGEAESGSAGVQPDKEYPGRRCTNGAGPSEGYSSEGSLFHWSSEPCLENPPVALATPGACHEGRLLGTLLKHLRSLVAVCRSSSSRRHPLTKAWSTSPRHLWGTLHGRSMKITSVVELAVHREVMRRVHSTNRDSRQARSIASPGTPPPRSRNYLRPPTSVEVAAGADVPTQAG
jgi:hypothetical protein